MEHRKSLEITLPSAPRPSDATTAPAAPGTRTKSGTRRTAMRVMNRKSVGMMAVYEQDPTITEAGTRQLVFESTKSCTRVTNFPADWQKLTEEELVAIRRSQS